MKIVLRRMMPTLYLACAFVAFPCAGLAQDSSTSAARGGPEERFGTWGVDLSGRDLSVKPGDDFQRYAVGKWLDTHPIADDMPSNGMMYGAILRNQERLKSIVLEAPKDSQIGALYKSFIDEAQVERADIGPLKVDLAAIDAIPDKASFADFMAGTSHGFGSSLFNGFVAPDPSHPDVNTLFLQSGGFGLPSRDYYLLDKYQKERTAYRDYIERTLKLTGTADPSAGADKVLAFETELAKLSWAQEDVRDMDKTNNRMTVGELQAYAPQINWSAFFAAADYKTSHMIVRDNTALKAKAALYEQTPLETLKLWERYSLISDASDYLPKRFVDSRFEFTRTFSGTSKMRPRWARGVDQVDGWLGELIGQEYVRRYFPQRSKIMMEQLVANLKAAAAERIRGNRWMSAATKQAALDKLAKMAVMVGYPEKFRSYVGLVLKPDDLYGNIKRSMAFESQYQHADLEKPVDRKKWGLTPATVNAYNSGLENKIVFPAGILQPPFFDARADPAVNYGAAGAIIGHEIMHGFDDQGRKVDASGKVRDWWTPQDGARFKALTAELGKQYSSYEAVPGSFINGKLTMGENIGDVSGLEVAYTAYHRSLHGKPAKILDGLTGDQRFFLAFAQAWRGAQRPSALKVQVASDVHSPVRFRTIGPVRNLDAWYKAFHVGPDSRYYLPPSKRVQIW